MHSNVWEPYTPSSVREQAETAQQILTRCAMLAQLSSMAGGICRVYLSDEHRQANALTAQWLESAGCSVWQDAVGNICGRYAADRPDAPTLMIGSHLDTIPDAGAYDGILGVLLGIAAIEALQARGERLPFNIDVVGFGEEEGVRFGTTLMTSRACAGTWDEAWWALTDSDGVSLEAAFQRFGLDPTRVGDAAGPTSQAILKCILNRDRYLSPWGYPSEPSPALLATGACGRV